MKSANNKKKLLVYFFCSNKIYDQTNSIAMVVKKVCSKKQYRSNYLKLDIAFMENLNGSE